MNGTIGMNQKNLRVALKGSIPEGSKNKMARKKVSFRTFRKLILAKFYLCYLNNDLGPKKFDLPISPNSAFKKYINPLDKLTRQLGSQVLTGDDYSNLRLPDMKIVLVRNKLKIVN
jgi:hypothetical protein